MKKKETKHEKVQKLIDQAVWDVIRDNGQWGDQYRWEVTLTDENDKEITYEGGTSL